PAGAADDLGARARHPRAGHDRPADDAPDGGGRTAVRPGGDHRTRSHDRGGDAGRARAATLPRASRDLHDGRRWGGAPPRAERGGRRLRHGSDPSHRARRHAGARLPHGDADARGRVPEAHRSRDPGLTMLKGLFKLSWIETKIFLREPMGVIGTLFMPLIFFLVMARFLRGVPHPSASVGRLAFNATILTSLLIVLGAVQS